MTTHGLDALRTIHTEDVAPVIASLTADEWAAPSACDGWRVQDLVAHIATNMKLFVDPEPAPDGAMADIEAMQDAMVATRQDWEPAQVAAEYEQFLEPWLGAIASFQEEPIAATETDLGQLGTHPMHLFADIYAFDHLVHVRWDMLAPFGPVARDMPALDDLRMRPTIEWMMAGLGPMCPGALAAATAPVQIDLTGAGAGTWTVSTGGVAEGGADDAAATVTSSAEDFVSWATTRSAWRDSCRIEGDEALAAAVLDALDII